MVMLHQAIELSTDVGSEARRTFSLGQGRKSKRAGLDCVKNLRFVGLSLAQRVRTDREGYGIIGLTVLSEGGVDLLVVGVGVGLPSKKTIVARCTYLRVFIDQSVKSSRTTGTLCSSILIILSKNM